MPPTDASHSGIVVAKLLSSLEYHQPPVMLRSPVSDMLKALAPYAPPLLKGPLAFCDVWCASLRVLSFSDNIIHVPSYPAVVVALASGHGPICGQAIIQCPSFLVGNRSQICMRPWPLPSVLLSGSLAFVTLVVLYNASFPVLLFSRQERARFVSRGVCSSCDEYLGNLTIQCLSFRVKIGLGHSACQVTISSPSQSLAG
jgi:hypothetical protein